LTRDCNKGSYVYRSNCPWQPAITNLLPVFVAAARFLVADAYYYWPQRGWRTTATWSRDRLSPQVRLAGCDRLFEAT